MVLLIHCDTPASKTLTVLGESIGSWRKKKNLFVLLLRIFCWKRSLPSEFKVFVCASRLLVGRDEEKSTLWMENERLFTGYCIYFPFSNSSVKGALTWPCRLYCNWYCSSTQRGGQFAGLCAGRPHINKVCYAMEHNTIYPLGYLDLMAPHPLIFSPLREKCSEPHVHLAYINILQQYGPTPVVSGGNSAVIFPSCCLRNIIKIKHSSAASERWAISRSLWMGLRNSFR